MQTHSTIALLPQTKNLLDQPFGRLVVIAFAGYRRRHARWECRCHEGNIVVVSASMLISGRTQSCGCLLPDIMRTKKTTHGKSDTAEFRIWWGMLERCEDPSKKAYPRYGGRGITVCGPWHDFMTFYNDMGPRPTQDHSLERVNNDDGYNPGNCIWATPAIQSRNTQRNNLITFNGITQCLADWAIATGLKRVTIFRRLRDGWTIEDALTKGPQPPGPKPRMPKKN